MPRLAGGRTPNGKQFSPRYTRAQQAAAEATWHGVWLHEDGTEIERICPRCVRGEPDCCRCRGARVLTKPELVKAMAWIWAHPNCQCATCRRLGPQPY